MSQHKSEPLRKAELVAHKYNQQLTCSAFRWDRYVYVRTDENFVAHIPSAFARRWEGWVFIFAEHHDPVVFDEDDVEELYEYVIHRHSNQIRKIKTVRKG